MTVTRRAANGQDVTGLAELLAELDTEITRAGVRGTVATSTSTRSGQAKARRPRSTRRPQDAPDRPKRKIGPQTLGKVFTAPDGKSYRPSMFLTLTRDSYGKVRDDGTPVDPSTYDYQRAARDALHFSALVDRFIQNLHRSWAMTLSTSAPSNHSGGWLRTCTWRSGARCHGQWCAR